MPVDHPLLSNRSTPAKPGAQASGDSIPRPEHPRPDFLRENWVNLNGEWEFAFDPNNIGEQRRWYRRRPPEDPFHQTINVPFPWESALSGVYAPDYRGAGWYRRRLSIPADWKRQGLRPILRFGAVDWNAKVWVNGKFALEHDGGYAPFELDLTPFLSSKPGKVTSGDEPAGTPGGSGANPLRPVIVVRAWDVCAADTPLGKQVWEWYTPSSGIWQTVWLEGRRACFIDQVHFSAYLAESRCLAIAFVEVDEPGRYVFAIHSMDDAFPVVELELDLPLGRSEQHLEIPVDHPRLWRPEDPYLYPVRVELRSGAEVRDSVETYFGMREVGRGKWGDSEHEYILLNGDPIYLRGVLDQAFHPDGLHTYPTDDDIRRDVEAARDAGYNLLRCHIKINDPRYYYWADRLGVLVMSDIPSCKIYTPRSQENWALTFRSAVYRDFSHPSIIAWILFNETWGLEEHETEAGWAWVREMYRLGRALDPTRLAEDNSACLYDHVATDINSWHFYINDYDRARRHIRNVVARTIAGSEFNFVGGEYLQAGEPLINSEYGGIGASDGDRDVAYCLKYLTSELRRHDKVVGYVYTELTDIEWEHNGILNYDRTAKEFGFEAFCPGMTVADLNSPDFLGFDTPPCQTASPGKSLSFPLFFSQFGPTPLPGVEIHWVAELCDALGNTRIVSEGSHSGAPARYRVTTAGEVALKMPEEAGLLTLRAQARTGDAVLSRNYVQVEIHDPDLPAVEQRGNEWRLRWSPGDFSLSEWSDVRVTRKGWKLTAEEEGAVEYELEMPAAVEHGHVVGMKLLFEAAARTASRRLDWRKRSGRFDYPQTDRDRKYPGDLVVSINGVTVAEIRLPDDPADARGVLSHHNEQDPGSYGFLQNVSLTSEQIQAILARAGGKTLTIRFEAPEDADYPSGLRLYGRRVGRYPVDPTLVLMVKERGANAPR